MEYDRQKIEILAELIGYRTIPVDIVTFIRDNYYLGLTCGFDKDTGESHTYQIWVDALQQIYPDPITTRSYVANCGCIGSGKTTMAKICLAYDIYKLTCMRNPAGYFGLIQKFFHFKIFNLVKWKAEDMVKEFYDWIDQSEYFQEQKKDDESIIHWIAVGGASRMSDIISDDVVTVVFSEMNFVKDFESGLNLINQGISRIESRFQKGFGLFNHIILDSSDTSVEAPVPYFLRIHPRGPETLVFKYAIWQAKPALYFKTPDEEGKLTFQVYKGDSEIHPCVIEKNTNTSRMDPDRFLEVPNELLLDFRSDITLALNEKAGVAVETTDQYFDPDKVKNSMTLELGNVPEVVRVDFYNNDSFIPIFEELIESLPKDRSLFGRLDLGLVNDRAGFAIGFIEDLNAQVIDGIVHHDPLMNIPIAVGIGRYPGQETSIDKLIELIIWIHTRIPFYQFTTDTYQSYAIKQALTKVEIETSFLSVDRTTEHHKMAKNKIYRGRVKLPKSTILKNELINLIDMGKKIDHHVQLNVNGDIGSNSKDIADAVVGLISMMSNAGEEAMHAPVVSNSQMQRFNDELLGTWIESESREYYKSMARNMFGV